MCDVSLVLKLLDDWTDLIATGEHISRVKASKRPGGLSSRIKRTTGHPIIFDADTYDSQQEIQKALCMQMPEMAHVIRSNPEIMDGHAWTCGDFIELYYSHFRLVVDKIRQVIEKQSNV